MIPKYPSIALLSLILALVTTYVVATRDSDEKPPSDETWHDRYVADSCKRCPKCCVTIPPEQTHCDDCPSETCLCIQGAHGTWMISPEVGE